MPLPSDLDSLVAQHLKIPADQVTDDTGMMTCAGWDSLTHVDLMLAIEQRYGVTIDHDQILDLVDVGAIRAFLAERAGDGAAGGNAAGGAGARGA
jgi:acyl carrier protein